MYSCECFFVEFLCNTILPNKKIKKDLREILKGGRDNTCKSTSQIVM